MKLVTLSSSGITITTLYQLSIVSEKIKAMLSFGTTCHMCTTTNMAAFKRGEQKGTIRTRTGVGLRGGCCECMTSNL